MYKQLKIGVSAGMCVSVVTRVLQKWFMCVFLRGVWFGGDVRDLALQSHILPYWRGLLYSKLRSILWDLFHS